MRTCITYGFPGDADAARQGNLATALSQLTVLSYNLIWWDSTILRYICPLGLEETKV